MCRKYGWELVAALSQEAIPSITPQEVELESDERELRDRIAWQSGRLGGGAARTAQIRLRGQSGLARIQLARAPLLPR